MPLIFNYTGLYFSKTILGNHRAIQMTLSTRVAFFCDIHTGTRKGTRLSTTADKIRCCAVTADMVYIWEHVLTGAW